MYKLTPTQIAWRLAQDIPNDSHVYLGEGIPALLNPYLQDKQSRVIASKQDTPKRATASEICIVQAEQVSELGELSLSYIPTKTHNTLLNSPNIHIVAIMEFFSPEGIARLVPACTQPKVLSRPASSIYTDIAVFDIHQGKVFIREIIEGITLLSLQMETEVELHTSKELRLLQASRA